MAGAGLRLGALNAGEGERGLLLRGGNSRRSQESRHTAQANFAQRNEANDNRKIPLVRSPVWIGCQSVQPGGDANTVHWVTPTEFQWWRVALRRLGI